MKKYKIVSILMLLFFVTSNAQTPNYYFERFYGTDGLDDVHSSSLKMSNGDFVHIGTSDYSSNPIHGIVNKTIYFVWTNAEGVVITNGSGVANFNIAIQDITTSTWLNTEAYSVCELDQNTVAITGKSYNSGGYEKLFIAIVNLSTLSVIDLMLYDLNGTGAPQQGNKIIAQGSNIYVTGFSTIALSGQTNKRFFVLKTNNSLTTVSSNYYYYVPNPQWDLDMEAYSLIFDNQINSNLVVVGYLVSQTLPKPSMNDLVTDGTMMHKYGFVAEIDDANLTMQTFKTYGTFQPGNIGTESVWFRDIMLEKTSCTSGMTPGYWLAGCAEYAGYQSARFKLSSTYNELSYYIEDYQVLAGNIRTEYYGMDIACDPFNNAVGYAFAGDYKVLTGAAYSSGLMYLTWWAGFDITSSFGLRYGLFSSGAYDDFHSISLESISATLGNSFIHKMFGTSNQFSSTNTDFKYSRTTTAMSYETCESDFLNVNLDELDLTITAPLFTQYGGPETYANAFIYDKHGRESELVCYYYEEEGARQALSAVSIPNLNISIFPNPATDILVTSEDVIAYRIYDLSGREIVNRNCQPSNKIDVSGLNSGMFLIEFNLSDKQTIGRYKFIKQ